MRSFVLAAIAAAAVVDAAALPAELPTKEMLRLSKRQGVAPVAGITSMLGRSTNPCI